jgi:predicted ATPase
MDRCIIDGIGFCQHAKVAIPQEIDNHVKLLRNADANYDLIFIFEPLEQYHFDEGRVLKPEESLAIQGLIEKAYANYGYSLISVPFMSPEERANFVLEKVREFENFTNKSH